MNTCRMNMSMLLSKADYSWNRGHYLQSQQTMMTESGDRSKQTVLHLDRIKNPLPHVLGASTLPPLYYPAISNVKNTFLINNKNNTSHLVLVRYNKIFSFKLLNIFTKHVNVNVWGNWGFSAVRYEDISWPWVKRFKMKVITEVAVNYGTC